MRAKQAFLFSVISCGLAVAAADKALANTTMFGFTPSGTQELILNDGSILLNAIKTGWYTNFGSYEGLSNYDVTTDAPQDLNDFFVFDLTGVNVPILSASLSIGNPSSGYFGPSGGALYSNFDVTTPISTLETVGVNPAVYTDLGSGILYAATPVGPADDGQQVPISLDAAAVQGLNRAEGSQFAIGGTLNAAPVPGPIVGAGLPGLVMAGLGALSWWRWKRKAEAAA